MALKPEIPAEEQEKKMALYGASLVEQAEKQMDDVQRWLKDGEEVSIQFGKRATIHGGMCPFIKSYTLVALGRKNPIKFSDFLDMRNWLQYRERSEAAQEKVKNFVLQYKIDKQLRYAQMYGGPVEAGPVEAAEGAFQPPPRAGIMAWPEGFAADPQNVPPPNEVLHEGHLRAMIDRIAQAPPPAVDDDLPF